MTTAAEAGFGLYVHWPFCRAKCPYCDFNSHVPRGAVDHAAFGDALVAELRHFAQLTQGRTLTSIFFGGGTPSLMKPAVVARVIDAAAENWRTSADIEITLEANPTSAEAANFEGYRTAGVNRVSIGVQALDDDALRALGRQHTVEEALAAFRMAARIFQRTSFDLIYARQHHTVDAWRDELSRALAEQQGHMSLYQLTIEPDTAYAALHQTGKLQVPDDDLAADLYDLTQDLTGAAGLPAYEVSNHAIEGHESRHNMLYWRYGAYAGIGPGAHSRLIDDAGGRIGISTLRDPQAWLDAVATRGHAIAEREPISPLDADRERLLMGLRLNDGIAPESFAAPPDPARIDALIEHGLLQRLTNDHIVATQAGRRVLNAVIAELAD